MMLGFLLARAGVDVVVLEKHADFLRDFRGDTIHPSTLELMHELGLLDEFLKLPHQEVARARRASSAPSAFTIADFRHLPTRCKFIALMPQWDFLDFLAEQGRRYPGFQLLMQTEATDLIERRRPRRRRARHDAGRRARDPRRSRGRLRRPPFDRARARRLRGRGPRRADGRAVVPAVAASRRHRRRPAAASRPASMFVMLNRGDYWQCAYVIPKGGIDAVQREGLAAFRDARRARCRRSSRDRVGEIDELGRRQAADRRGRPAAAMAPAGPALHRRRRARDVAGRRRRHQPRDPGRGRRGQHPGRAAAHRNASTRRICAAVQERRDFPTQRHSAHAGRHAEQLLSPARCKSSERARSRRCRHAADRIGFRLLRRIPARVARPRRPARAHPARRGASDPRRIGSGRAARVRNDREGYLKSSGFSSIGLPCGVRSAAWSQAS